MDGQVADAVQDELSIIVTKFGDWVKQLAQAGGLKNEQDVQTLESRLRDGGRDLVNQGHPRAGIARSPMREMRGKDQAGGGL